MTGQTERRDGIGEPRDAKDPNAIAAHQLLSELRTRIATQPLPYQYGIEARALESLWEVFGQARSIMKANPGCDDFAEATTRMLNLELRPFAAKWHRAHADGYLNSGDGANDFRADLEKVRSQLIDFANELHEMAYGRARKDVPTPPPLSNNEVDSLFKPLPFGIATNGPMEKGQAGQMNATERAAVTDRRRQYSLEEEQPVNAIGLGLSGGGIRSSTFCLGVVQVLASRRLLREVDFLSTVSGGGFLGAFLTTALRDDQAEAGIASPNGPDTPHVRRLRTGAKYLAATNLRERWIMVTQTLAGMVLNWSAPLFVIVIAALVASVLRESHFATLWPWIFSISAVGAAVLLAAYAGSIRYASNNSGFILGTWVAASMSLVLIWLFTVLFERIGTISVPLAGLTGIATAVVAAAPAIDRFIPIIGKPRIRRAVLRLAMILAALILPIGALLVAFLLVRFAQDASGILILSAVALVLGVVAFFLLDVNMTGPHRLYRDHIARTFITSANGDAKPIRLQEINSTGFAPYQLINATANFPHSDSSALRERRGDFFLFSRGWCGAPSLGYWRTEEWQGGDLDLATAVAVSGGAASARMGMATVPALSALLAFLNVRLGYWIRRPGSGRGAPGFLCIAKEMFGFHMNEKSDWLNLSDGGHIENMGVYELLRRRCKFIISIDGEADGQSTFHGHLALVRHALIDFGIRIDPDLTALRPDKATRFSRSHTMMCRVHYPKTADTEAGVGLILYLKLSLTGNESELLKRYRIAYPDFPHQSTLDQFFDEEQFEAYRQLGVHVAEGLFHPAVLGTRQEPTSVHEWFRALSGNLLLPTL